MYKVGLLCFYPNKTGVLLIDLYFLLNMLSQLRKCKQTLSRLVKKLVFL